MPPDASVRAFVAVELSEEVRENAGRIADQLQQAGQGVKWVAPENMHLTLKFLGNVPEELLPRVSDALTDSTRNFGPIELTVGGVGSFPPKGKPRVIWLGVSGQTKRLTQVAGLIDTALETVGFTPENRPYSAHLTLGRIKGGRKKKGGGDTNWRLILPDYAGVEVGDLTVSEVVLFKSDLTPEGPIYTALERFGL